MCYGVSDWNNKEISSRKFDTLEEMNNAIVNGINNSVKEDDVLYFLGDWSFGGIESIWDFRKRIICKNIHFILGNHDQHIKKDKIIEIDNPIRNINVKGLFTSVQNYLEIKINKQIFVLSHYPIEEWFEMDLNSIHLHGHCHSKINNCELNTKYKRMDIGIDWKEFRPYSFDEIMKIMRNRKFKKHNERM